jgi:hypothetical protein
MRLPGRPGRARRSWSALLALVFLALFAGCRKGPLPSCPGEDAGTRAGGALPERPVRSVSDPTAAGELRGRPTGRVGRDRPKKMILLLDYSGSMYGGYGKEQGSSCNTCAAGMANGRPSRTLAGRTQPYYVGSPDFREFLARWLHAATPEASDLGLEVLLFNGKIFRLGDSGIEPFLPGTELRFSRRVSSANAAEIESWLRQIPENPYTVDPVAPNLTDSRAALRRAVDAAGDEAILWLVTDNIVDEGAGSADPDARLTTEFYRELADKKKVQMIAAYPIFKAEPCSWMCGTSLFAYGMYVSGFERPESAEFHRLGGTTPQGGGPEADGLLWNSELQKLAAEYSGRAAAVGRGDLAGVPVRLKPIDTEALAIDFAHPAISCDKRVEFGQKLPCRARIEVRNTLRHQTVDSAQLRLSNEVLLPRQERGRFRLPWASAVCAGGVETLSWQVRGGRHGAGADPIEIGPLAPLGKAIVDVRFRLPPVEVDAFRSVLTLFQVALTNRIVLDGHLKAEIHDFRTSLAIDPQRFASVYGSAQLPAIFRKGEVGSAAATYQIDARLANDGQALALLALLAVVGGGGLVLLVVMRFQSQQFTVVVDGGESLRLSLPRLSRRELEVGGAVRAYLTRGWGAGYRIAPRRGTRLRRDGSAWLLKVSDDIGEEHRLEVFRGWAPGRPKSPFSGHMENW